MRATSLSCLELWLDAAALFCDTGAFDAALACVGEASAISTLSSDVLCQHAMLSELQCRFEDAVCLYERALSLSPLHSASLLRLGVLAALVTATEAGASESGVQACNVSGALGGGAAFGVTHAFAVGSGSFGCVSAVAADANDSASAEVSRLPSLKTALMSAECYLRQVLLQEPTSHEAWHTLGVSQRLHGDVSSAAKSLLTSIQLQKTCPVRSFETIKWQI